MFWRMDEDSKNPHTVFQSITDSLASVSLAILFFPKLLGCCHQDWNAGDLRNRSSDFALFPEKLKSLHSTCAGNGCAVLARLCARCDGSRHDAQLESALQVGPPADLPAVQRDSLLVLMCAGLVDWVSLMTLASRRLLPWLRLNHLLNFIKPEKDVSSSPADVQKLNLNLASLSLPHGPREVHRFLG